MSKDPLLADRIVLKNGGVVETEAGTDIITVSAAGAVTLTGVEAPSVITLAENKALVGNSSGVGSAKTVTSTFTGTSPVTSLDIATPVFSGTGQSSAGQVITTTDNQTMTLNQCAGMWFVSATHGPYLIASNTAVTGAPAVLTIYGTAPTTDAGTYKILKTLAPVGTNAIVYT